MLSPSLEESAPALPDRDPQGLPQQVRVGRGRSAASSSPASCSRRSCIPTDYGFVTGHARRRARRSTRWCRLRADLPGLRDPGARGRRAAHGGRARPGRQAPVRPLRRPGAGATSRTSTTSPAQMRTEIEHFFSMYKEPEGREVDVHGWEGRDVAEAVLQEAREALRATDSSLASVPLLAARGRHEVVRRPPDPRRPRPRARRRRPHRRARPQRRRQVDAAAHARRRGARRTPARSPAAAGSCMALAAAGRRGRRAATRSRPCSPRGPSSPSWRRSSPRSRARSPTRRSPPTCAR